MNRNIQISIAQESDAQNISTLIYTTSQSCCFTTEQPCPEWFEESVNSTHIAKSINDKNMDWLIASIDAKLVGVLALSNRTFVKYFFVNPSYQNSGIGKRLWNTASQKGILGDSLKVRSSLNAVPIYERLGFVTTEPQKVFEGLHYQTMVATNR